MNSLDNLQRFRRPAVGAIILAAVVASLVVWTAGAVAASREPQGYPVGGARTAAQAELASLTSGTSKAASGSQSDPCSVTTVTSSGSNPGPIGSPQPLAVLPDVDNGTPLLPILAPAHECSGDTTPGFTPSGPSTGTNAGNAGTGAGTNAGTNIDSNPGTILGPFNPGPAAGTPEPVQLLPEATSGTPKAPGGGKSDPCSIDVTTVTSSGSNPGPIGSPQPLAVLPDVDNGTPLLPILAPAHECSGDTTPGSTESHAGTYAGS